jgi:hypothetical protein
VLELIDELGMATPAQQWRLDSTLDVMDASKIEARSPERHADPTTVR